MNPLSILPAGILLAPLAPSFSEGPTLAFAEGQTLTQSWVVTAERSIETSILNIGGNEQDIGSGSVETSQSSMEVVDRVLESKEGTLSKFSRTYESIGSSRDVEGMESSEGVRVDEGEETSALEGQEVIFSYDADDEAYEAAWGKDSEGEGAWLDELVPNTYLPGLLPEDEVEEGTSWEVPAAFTSALLKPLGSVNVEEEEEDPDVPDGGIALSVPSPTAEFDWADVEGEIKATWKETEEEDGKRLAKVILEVELSGTYDLTDAFDQDAEERGVDETYETAEFTQELAGEILILWDLDADRPHSLSGELEGTMSFDAVWSLDAGFVQLDIESERVGTERYSIEATFGAK